jgi:hypothetical protein
MSYIRSLFQRHREVSTLIITTVGPSAVRWYNLKTSLTLVEGAHVDGPAGLYRRMRITVAF